MSISNISEERDIYQFTLSNIDVSLANALRRTILRDIPSVVIEEENVNIEINTCRLHNEILKHRLACIPIYSANLELLPGNYILELEAKNETDDIIYVTSGDFRIKNKSNGNYVTDGELARIFPKHEITQYHVDFLRLRPKIGSTIPGEEIRLTAEFSIKSAADNSIYSVVSKCAYGNTIDKEKVESEWEKQEHKLRTDELSQVEIDFHKNNYYVLDAQRFFKKNCFDFIIQTVGVFSNKEIIKKACVILQNKLYDLIQGVDADVIPIKISETTIENSYDIVLENEDYTLGKVIEYILYDKYYDGSDKLLNFCGFSKIHPHNSDSIIRLGYLMKVDKNTVRQNFREACVFSQEVFKNLFKMF
jgi:DNA-directed RNA polymerase II subunit RPB3